MSISKPPAAPKPHVVSDDAKDRVQTISERLPEPGRDLPGESHGGGGNWWLSMLVWASIISVGFSGWYYRDKWWPYVAQLTAKPPVKQPVRVVPVVTAPVLKKDMDVYINGLGTVTAFKTVTIRSRVEGELINVAFTEGQMIQEGDVLAEIDRRPFEVQLQQAEGQLARDEATLKSADFTYKRYQELMQSKSIAPQQVDEQRSLVQQTTGAIQSDQAAVANATLQLTYCHITAPITGRIGLRLVDQGNIVRANDPNGLAVITQLQPISLVFTIPQDDISRVQKSSTGGKELMVTAFDRDMKIKLAAGKLLAIDNQVDATTGTVRLKAIFDNEDGLLFPNQFVNARLLVDTKKDAIVVPNAAVQRGPSSYFVYIVVNDDSVDPPVEKVEQRMVAVGLTEGAETVIESGLSPGEIVVTDGLDKLQKDTLVSTAAKEKEKGKDSGGEKGSPGDKPQGDKRREGNKDKSKPDGQTPHSSDPSTKSVAKIPTSPEEKSAK